MNNFKKFVAVLLGVVMACVFATSAFAASKSEKADAIKREMAKYGLTGFDAVIDDLNETQLQVLIDNRGTLEQKVSQVIAYKNDNHPAEDQVANLNSQLSSVQGILSQAGITATMSVSVNGNTVTAVPAAKTANNANGSTRIVVTVDPSKETNATENGTAASAAVSNAAKNSAAASSVKTVSSAANPITASSSAVIKATGDNTAVVFAVAALAVAGVLGMAVRKERAL